MDIHVGGGGCLSFFLHFTCTCISKGWQMGQLIVYMFCTCITEMNMSKRED